MPIVNTEEPSWKACIHVGGQRRFWDSRKGMLPEHRLDEAESFSTKEEVEAEIPSIAFLCGVPAENIEPIHRSHGDLVPDHDFQDF